MFEVRKTFEISAAHKLSLSYASKCSNLHGHNWTITVCCKSNSLNQDGMVFDFSFIKQTISERLDHTDITSLIKVNGDVLNPTAENIAFWISTQIGESCHEVVVQESDGNVAIWRKE